MDKKLSKEEMKAAKMSFFTWIITANVLSILLGLLGVFVKSTMLFGIGCIIPIITVILFVGVYVYHYAEKIVEHLLKDK